MKLRLKSSLHLDIGRMWIISYRVNIRKFLNILLLLLTILMLKPSTSLAKDAQHAIEEVFLDVFINKQEKGTIFLISSEGLLFAGAGDLRRWRLRLPDTKPITFYGEDFYALEALKGLTSKFDVATQTLAIEVPPKLFDATYLNGVETNLSAPYVASPGGFLNYDVLAYQAKGITNSNGLLEIGGFGSWGTAETRILGSDLNRQASAIRLESTWTRDKPMQIARLRFGDGITGASSWGGAKRFGGVQWGTDFSLQPGIQTFPLPGISGEAVLPSTLELYVDNNLSMRREVLPGPFSIQDLPVSGGQGDARLVVRDILGREQIITRPYFTSSRVLKPGLQDYSYELGFLRKNFGINSNNYGQLVAVGTHRLGFNEKFTGEVHAELLNGQQTVGMGGVFLSPISSVMSGSLALSHSENGVGKLLGITLQRQSGNLSINAKTQIANNRFKMLGLQAEELAPKHISHLNVGLDTTNHGSFVANYTQQAYRDQEENKIVSLSYTRKVGKTGILSASVKRRLSEDVKTIFSLNFSMFMNLGNRTTANISMSAEKDRKSANLQLSRSRPAGNGFGYRLFSELGNSDRRDAEVSLQNSVGNFTLGANQAQGETAFRGSASGGVAFLGGRGFFSRRITDSFAVVQVPDYSGVGIYVNNQLSTHTDANGNALVTGLQPYQKNSVRLEQSDLPFEAQIDAVQLDAVPYFRSGLMLKFPVKRSRGALLTVVHENGEPVSAGALAQIIGDSDLENENFPIGLRGELYLTGLETNNRLQITLKKQSCEFALPFPETTDPLPHLGAYICVGVEP